MGKRVLPIFLSVLVMMACAHTDIGMPENAPGRPRLGKGTVLTGRGTRLRGVYWSLDYKGELPDRESVREIRDFGMNTLHVYAERHDALVPAGSYVKQMDTISSPFSDDQVNPGEIDKCERNEISWLVFMEIRPGYLDSWRFKGEIDKRKLGWQPDFGTWPAGPSAYVPPHDLALGKKTDVSSVENFQGTPLLGRYATDGDDLTRWGSGFADDQYIIVDLEKPAAFDTIVIRWDGQYAKAYDVLVSNDMTNWKRIYEKTDGAGGDSWVYWKERIHVTATARYLKLSLKKRRMEYGFSICSLEVYDTKKEE
jgi:hypothetical protein